MKTTLFIIGLLAALTAKAQVEFREDGVYLDGQFIATRLCDATNNYATTQHRAKFLVALNKWDSERQKELDAYNTPTTTVTSRTVTNAVVESVAPIFKNGLRTSKTNFAWRGTVKFKTNSSPVDARVYVRPERPR